MTKRKCEYIYKKDENLGKMEFDSGEVEHDFRRLVDQDGRQTLICKYCGVLTTLKDNYMKEEHDILFFAFRYALSRKTYVSSMMVGILSRKWDELPKDFKKQIQRETKDAIDKGLAGDDCDIEEWKKLLSLE